VIRHLLVTDIRRFRWILAGWLVLLGAYSVLLFVTPTYVGSPGYDNLNTAIVLLVMVTHLVPLVLVPLIVQADAPVGTDAFWTTRPIPPSALLAAKAILLALAIVMLPGLLELAAMTATHVAASERARIALQSVLESAAWLTLLMIASAVTANYAKFALLCASTVVAMAIGVIVMEAVIRSRMQESVGMLAVSVSPVPMPESADGTSGLVFQLGLILAGCALLVVQYRRRQRIVSVPVGAGGVVLAFVAASWWPWPLLRAQAPLPEWTAGLRLSAASTAAPFDAQGMYLGDQPRFGRLSLRVGGVAPGWFATASMRDASVTLPDGRVIRSRSRGFSASPSPEGTNEPPQRVAIRQLLSVDRVADRLPPRGENVVAITVTPDDYRRLESTTAVYRGSFVVDLLRVERAGTLPLQPNAAFDAGVYQLALRDIRRIPSSEIAFNAVETRATSMFDPGPDESYTVYAVNPARSEALEAVIYPLGEVGGFAGFGVHVSVGVGGGFTRRGVVVAFAAPSGEGLSFRADAEWFRNAHLAVVRTTPAGQVVRAVEIPGLRACTSQNGEC
jgi:hypothetical protein